MKYERLWMPLLAFLSISSQFVQIVVGYSKEAILADSNKLANELLQFRGPILKDAWFISNSSNGTMIRHTKGLCDSLFHTRDGSNTTVLNSKKLPEYFRDAFLMGNKAEELSNSQHIKRTIHNKDWSKQALLRFQSKSNFGQFDHKWIPAMAKYKKIIDGKFGIVQSSETPWVEAMLFKLGARNITSIQRNLIETDYPLLRITQSEIISREYLTRQFTKVDFVFIHDTLEYELSTPYSDLELLARFRCLLKPNGILFFTLPMAPDAVMWPSYRLYGKYRTTLLLIGWKLIDIFPENCDVIRASGQWGCIPLLVVRKLKA